MRTWPVKAPDLSWADWRYALEECIATGERTAAARRLEDRWSPSGEALVCLSVRSAFDLLLRASDWEVGDEVMFTAMTIPHMPRIARLHGLFPVPLDIDPVSAQPAPDALAERVSPRTRAVVHAHLFGSWEDPAPLIEAAHGHGLIFVEDCAQCYRGPGWTGHPAADVTLFSFGPWKTATALGGGIARVKDARLLERMREIQREDPVQGRGEYLTTVLTYGGLKAAAGPGPYGVFVAACRTLGVDHRALVQRLTRGYRGAGFARRIRRQPAAPLLAMLERRLDHGAEPVRRRAGPAETLMDSLGPGVVVPGRGGTHHSWWMVPVLAEERAGDLMAELLGAGFDTVRGRLSVVEGDGSPGREEAGGARRLQRSSVYLPFDPGMPDEELRKVGRLVRSALGLGGAPGET